MLAVWCALLFVLNIIDGILTYFLLSAGATEMNPIMNLIINYFSFPFGLILAKGIAAILIFYLWIGLVYFRINQGASLWITVIFLNIGYLIIVAYSYYELAHIY